MPTPASAASSVKARLLAISGPSTATENQRPSSQNYQA
jgi:hypothetical protein